MICASTEPSPTARQIEVLAFIATSIDHKGWAPTIRELVDALGVTSTNTVVDHLDALERKGLILRDGSPRAIAITNLGRKHLPRRAA